MLESLCEIKTIVSLEYLFNIESKNSFSEYESKALDGSSNIRNL